LGCKLNKQKTNKKRERIQDVVEVVCSNTFASIQQVSEDNLKEFLVSILDLCIMSIDNIKKKINDKLY
jgi:tRNA A37 threonylcarbamoyladenosine dehydratase